MTQYERVQLIGEGRQGLVYRAHDRVRGKTVALKTLHALDPESCYRLKHEFRALADVSHPNLVELYDLVVDGEQCFFTMELVEGVDLVTWARAAGASRYPRLRAAVRQLALAIGALHAAGQLHRDVKPTNVLVEAGGRVVVLDFGLAAGIPARRGAPAARGTLAGTLPYVAPEQLWGAPPSPAGDWYSVGATLYEALVDRVPFDQEALAELAAGAAPAPPSPRELVPEVPGDLAALAIELLRHEPARRPSFDAVVRRLEGGAAPCSATAAGAPLETAIVPPFVGRGQELAALEAALRATRDGAVTVQVRGVSGIGKTALVERFLAGVEARQAAVTLRGRCHPHESIPFKAVDGVIDELSRFLATLPADARAAVLPADAAALARVFPVLGGLEGGASAAAPLEGELHEVRRRAFTALRALVGAIAARSGLVLWIDDLQWGDLDSVAILDELRRAPALPRLLLLESFRSEDVSASEPLQALRAAADDLEPMAPPLEMELGPLTAAEARTLAGEALAHAARPASDRDLDLIAAESRGSPFFAGELARHFAARADTPDWTAGLAVGDVVERRIETLPDASRRVLNVVAIAGRPIDDALAAMAAGVADARPLCRRLRHQSLLRAVSVPGGAGVTIYHDRIRDAVTRLMPPAARRALHRRLADALETRADPDPLLLVEHYLQAGEPARAADYACSSAERAARALAFHQAARLYRRALDLGATARPRWQLQEARAGALANAGFGAEAARAYLDAAGELAPAGQHPDVVRLKRLGADQFLRSGYVEEGLAAVREVLAAVNLRYFESAWGALLSLVLNRVRLRLARRLAGSGPRRRAPADRERLEACWAAGLGVSVFDSIRGAEFQVRHALLSLASDDPSHRARSLATEAVVMAMEHPGRNRRRIAALRDEGARWAAASGDARAEAHALLMSAGVAFFENRYREALADCDRGEELCRTRCVGSAWELANMRFLAAYSLAYLGELAELRARLPAMLRHARERGDQFALTNYRVGLIILAWLARDTVAAARRELEAALAGRWPQRSAWQHYMGLYAHVQIDLYAGEPARAWERLRAAEPELRRAQMLRLQSIRIETRLLRARAALAMAAAPGGELPAGASGARLLRQVARDAGAIARERARWSAPLADGVWAGLAAVRGDAAGAADRLARAAVGFEGLELGLHAAAARWQLAALAPTGGDGAARAAADAWMRARGVAVPARMAALLVPGVRSA